MKIKFILLVQLYFSINALLFAQNKVSYYLEIANEDYVPILSTGINNEKKLNVKSDLLHSQDINNIFDAYTIYDFQNPFIKSDDIGLRKIYIITLSINDSLEQLVSTYNYYSNYEIIDEYEPLLIPNDFEMATGLSNVLTSNEQNDLIMIRAQEAWDITIGNPNVLIGVADIAFKSTHEDLRSEILLGIGNYEQLPGQSNHGTAVSGFASGATNNGVGNSSIGYNTKMVVISGGSVNNLYTLHENGAKVVNLSFGSDFSTFSQTTQNILTNIWDNGTVNVIAGGNGEASGSGNPSTYYYPASYKNVIAVSSVGNKNEIGSTSQLYDNWKDVHKVYWNEQNSIVSHQHNDSIDIVVPLYYPSPRLFGGQNLADQYRDSGIGGTSYSAPIVAGTVGLIFSVNDCLSPSEVETVLKLTAVVVDTIPENFEFYGKLGAGRLDAYEAVKMAKDMADDFGTVEVKDRILYRPWFYKLETAPFEIKMTNNDVSEGSKLKFKARNNIEILSGDYYPSTGGYIDLSIDDTLALDCPPASGLSSRMSDTSNSKSEVQNNFDVIPTLVVDNVSVTAKKENSEQMSQIKVYDFFGQEVFMTDKINSQSTIMNLNILMEGIYVLKVFNNNGVNIYTQKIIKK